MNLETFWKKLSEGRIDDAITEVASNIDSGFKSASAEASIAGAKLLKDVGETKRAEEILNSILTEKPNNIDALFARAQIYYQQRNWDKVIIDLTSVIQRGDAGNILYAYQLRGYARYCSNFHREAIEDLNFYLKIKPDDVETVLIRATSHYNILQYQRSINDYSQVLLLNSHNPKATIGRAYSYFKLGDWSNAVSDLNNYIQLNSDEGLPYYWRSWA